MNGKSLTVYYATVDGQVFGPLSSADRRRLSGKAGISVWPLELSGEDAERFKAEGRRQKAEGRRQKAEGRRHHPSLW